MAHIPAAFSGFCYQIKHLYRCAFNARLKEIIQVGPVWTPPEHLNKGYARLLVVYPLNQEKLRGIKQAILLTDNPAAIKTYLAIGFKKIIF